MKKLLIITNLIWAILFGWFFFKGCSPIVEDCNTVKLNYESVTKDYGRLSATEARELADLYYQNHYNPFKSHINPRMNKPLSEDADARSIWFSLETLKKFIWDIETKSANCGKGCDKLNLGVRMYYAEYPKDQRPDLPQGEMMKHTIFMVPTYSKRDAHGVLRDYDFNPKYPVYNGKGSACSPITLKELFEEQRHASLQKTSPFQFAQLTPPTEDAMTDKFILSPHSKSLVKTKAVDFPDKEDTKPDTKPTKDSIRKLSQASVFVGFPLKLKLLQAGNAGASEFTFQNHGAMCPIYCEDENSFNQ